MATGPIVRFARYVVAPGNENAARDAVVAFVDAVKAHEPGTLLYESYVEDDGRTFLHVMAFRDEAAAAFHRGTAHVRAFVEKLYPLCEVEPSFTDAALVRSTRP